MGIECQNKVFEKRYINITQAHEKWKYKIKSHSNDYNDNSI